MSMNQNENAPQAECEKPGYYSVTPASVRYDKSLPQGAKLLYGEITALCSKEGYCWAGNAYFAALYEKDERTIRNWINALRDAGHIAVSFKYVQGSKEIETRLIGLSMPPAAEVGKKFSPPPDGQAPAGMENIFQRWGKNFPYVGKKFSAGGEKIFRDSSTANNTATTTASESPAPLEPRHEAAAAESQMQQLKAALLAVDRRLVFDRSFYPRAAAFMRSRRLDARYLSWLLRECLNRNPRSLSGLFFKLFFAENIAEQFALLHAPPPEREKAFSDCPGCGTPRESGSACPECGLDPADCEDDVRRIRQIYALPEGRRKNYFQRRKAIVLKTCADGGASFAEMRERVKTLDAEFGIASSA